MKFNLIKVLFFVYLGLTAQTASHYKKYWYFKSRLNNDFIKVGLGDGESIPFNQRGWSLESFNNENTRLYAGDGSAMLGYYIAVLATEYKLLQLSNQNTEKVKHELFCALNAINRLDYKAESVFQNNAYNLNGFFIRDDIPSSLLLDSAGYNHFNYYNSGSIGNNLNNRGFLSHFSCGANQITSDWIQRVEKPSSHQIEMSQDQVYNILFGLAFVNKFVPISETDNGAVFGYGSGQASLTQEARNITNRILSHIRNPKDLNGNPCGNPGNTFPNNWRIRNPTTCNLVSAGDNAEVFAYALGEAQCFINGGATFGNGTIAFPPNPLISCPGNGYHNSFSQSSGRMLWEGVVDTYIGVPNCPNTGIDNRVMATNLLAICNCAYGNIFENVVNQLQWVLKQVPVIGGVLNTIIGWVWQWVQVVVTTVVPVITNNSWSDILLNSYSPGANLDHGPLARKILHGGIYQSNGEYSVEHLLDLAPCNNIYNLGNGLNSGLYWSSDNRLDHPNRSNLSATQNSTALCPGVDLIKGEYNGIDFLLYHNLWYLHKWQQNNLLSAFIDLSDLKVDLNGATIGNTPNTFINNHLLAFEFMKIENTKFKYDNPLTPAYWRSGKTICLGPGTEVLPNSNLHAYIQKFDCATDFGQFRPIDGDSANHEFEIRQYHYTPYPKRELESGINSNTHYNNFIKELSADESEENLNSEKNPIGLIDILPNPTNGLTKVFYNIEKNDCAKIQITDLTGKILSEINNLRNGREEVEINLSQFENGTYIVKFSSIGGIIKFVKVIKIN